MKTQYDNWDCEGSRRGVTRLRRRIGCAVLILLVLGGGAFVAYTYVIPLIFPG